jgi:hypothetical protein
MDALRNRQQQRKRLQLRARLKASRREQARKARSARRRIKRIHRRLPRPIHDLFGPLPPAFTRPTYRRFVLLVLAAILTTGAHTVANLLRCLGPLAAGDPTSYHRFTPFISSSTRR